MFLENIKIKSLKNLPLGPCLSTESPYLCPIHWPNGNPCEMLAPLIPKLYMCARNSYKTGTITPLTLFPFESAERSEGPREMILFCKAKKEDIGENGNKQYICMYVCKCTPRSGKREFCEVVGILQSETCINVLLHASSSHPSMPTTLRKKIKTFIFKFFKRNRRKKLKEQQTTMRSNGLKKKS